jgi:Ser/Thr protein kinase RdoA (MazF antagonist)
VALHAQLTWLLALRRETGLLVPEPLPMSDGSLVGRVSIEGAPKPRHFTLVSWVPGQHKLEDLSPTDLSLAGSFAARLHKHAERYAVPDPSALPRRDYWDWSLGKSIALWSKGEEFYSASEMEVFRVAARRIQEDVQALGEGRDVFGLIHRDFHLNNLVFDGSTVGAIDFDNCCFGHYLLDLSTMVMVLANRYGDHSTPMIAAFLESYLNERSLPDGYQGYLDTFVAIRVLSLVNRELQLRISDPQYQWRDPHFLSRAVKKLRSILEPGEVSVVKLL